MNRFVLTAVLIAFVAPHPAFGEETVSPEEIEHGKTIAQSLCASCHAINETSQSPLAEAPPFRTLGQRYPIVSLEESLAEGIVTGHDGMPEFEMEPDEINAFLAYLAVIQEP